MQHEAGESEASRGHAHEPQRKRTRFLLQGFTQDGGLDAGYQTVYDSDPKSARPFDEGKGDVESASYATGPEGRIRDTRI